MKVEDGPACSGNPCAEGPRAGAGQGSRSGCVLSAMARDALSLLGACVKRRWAARCGVEGGGRVSQAEQAAHAWARC